MPLPIVNEQGQEFASVEAFNNLLLKGRDAQYLLTPHMFHGGVHLSDESVPWGRDRAPVRCIADGEAVAYRMMKQYLTSEYQSEKLRYSNSFCLVRHHYHEVSSEGEKRGFRYYSLYMHLCPLEAYPQANCYRLKQARRVRHSVPSADFQPPTLILNAGEEFELVDGVARERGEVAGQGEFEFARIKILTAGGSSAEVLATEGMDNLWLAMDEHAIEPAFTVKRPSWIYDQIEAVVLNDMIGRADPPGNNGDTGYPLAGGDAYRVAKGSLIQFSAHEVEWQEINGKARQMARCRVVPMAITVWLCVEVQNIEIKRQGTSTLDKLYTLPKPVAIKGGDVIGYLGCYESPDTRFGGRNEEHLVHLEVFSDDPNVETIVGGGRWQTAGYKLVKSDSHGALVNPVPDFFGELYRACDLDKDGDLSAAEIWEGLKNKRTADGLFKIVAQHNSEWWAPTSQAMLEQFAAVEKEPEEALLRAHEQERVLKLSWMDKPEVRRLGFGGPKVWFFYPMVFNELHDGIYGSPRTVIDGSLVDVIFLEFNDGNGIDDSDYHLAAQKIGCEVAAIKAVANTESGVNGSYYNFNGGDDDVPSILFERHYFSRYTKGVYDATHSNISSMSIDSYGKYSEQYKKILKAYSLDPDAALKSASWGKFQIMGANYKAAGYASVSDFVLDMSRSEKNHLKAFVNYINADSRLKKAMVNKDWLGFACIYNGPAQKGYDVRMRDAYDAIVTQ